MSTWFARKLKAIIIQLSPKLLLWDICRYLVIPQHSSPNGSHQNYPFDTVGFITMNFRTRAITQTIVSSIEPSVLWTQCIKKYLTTLIRLRPVSYFNHFWCKTYLGYVWRLGPIFSIISYNMSVATLVNSSFLHKFNILKVL